MRRSAILASSSSSSGSKNHQHPSASSLPPAAVRTSTLSSCGPSCEAGASASVGNVRGGVRGLGNVPSAVVEFRCLFSTQLIKKRKTWQDGLLRLYPSSGRCSVLRAPSDAEASDETKGSSNLSRPPGAGGRGLRLALCGVVDGRQLSAQEVRGVLGGNIDEIEFETCIVTVERKNTHEEVSCKMDRINASESVIPIVKKFKPPGVIAPPRLHPLKDALVGSDSALSAFKEPWDGKMQGAKPRIEPGSKVSTTLAVSGPALYRVDDGELDDIWACADHGHDKHREATPPVFIKPYAQVLDDAPRNNLSARQQEKSRYGLRMHEVFVRDQLSGGCDAEGSGDGEGPQRLLAQRGYFGVAEPFPAPPLPSSKRARLDENEHSDDTYATGKPSSSSLHFGRFDFYGNASDDEANDDDVPLGFINDPTVQTSPSKMDYNLPRFQSTSNPTSARKACIGGDARPAEPPRFGEEPEEEEEDLHGLLAAEADAQWW